MMYDFLVIGGGIAGLSTAARLAPFGKTALLEAENVLAYHTTGRSAAMFEENYGLPSTIALNRASATFHREFEGGLLSERGLMLLGTSTDGPAFETDLAYMNMNEISLAEALQFVPILSQHHVKRVGYHAAAYDIDTHRLTQGFARQVAAHSGEIITNARVTKAVYAHEKWQVQTENGHFGARLLINAAGAWADDLATMAGVGVLGLQPFRRSMACIPAPGGHDLSGWPMMFGAGESWYAKPDAGSLLVSPADEDPMAPFDAWPDDMVLAQGIERYQENVTEPVTRVTSSWAGLRTFAPDRNLVIGFEPAHPGFFWVAGQGGYGIQSSPAASLLAADVILGRQSELEPETVAALAPDRLRG